MLGQILLSVSLLHRLRSTLCVPLKSAHHVLDLVLKDALASDGKEGWGGAKGPCPSITDHTLMNFSRWREAWLVSGNAACRRSQICPENSPRDGCSCLLPMTAEQCFSNEGSAELFSRSDPCHVLQLEHRRLLRG